MRPLEKVRRAWYFSKPIQLVPSLNNLKIIRSGASEASGATITPQMAVPIRPSCGQICASLLNFVSVLGTHVLETNRSSVLAVPIRPTCGQICASLFSQCFGYTCT